MTRFSAGYGIVYLLLVSSLTSGCAASQSTAPAPPYVSPAYCTDHTRSAHGGDAEAATLEREVAQFKELLEQSLMYRQETVRLAKYLKDKERVSTPLSGEDIDNLNLGTAAHLRLREKLYALALAHECWVDDGAPVLSPERRLTGVTVSLAAALTLYDNYLLAISAVEADTKLRRFINRPDSGYQKRRSRLDSVTAQFTSVTNRQRVRKALRFYEQEIARLSPQVRPGCDLAYLDAYLKQSPSYAMVREYAPFAVLKGKVDFLATVTTDTLISLEQEGVNLFSMLFGNATGMVATRHGKLYDRPTLADQIKKELRSGDILLEKTPFRMTDRFIPGFWGHAAVWVGSEEELKALGIWDDPAVRPYQKQIREGHRVAEALRTGVTLNSLEHFMNIDDLGILRQRELTDSERAAVVIRTLRQLGKGYNFNFDVEATDRIVCSGLVYLAYARVPWQSAQTLGRVTFTPDDVASQALPGGALDLVVFVHDGEWVNTDRLKLMTELMGAGTGNL